MAMPDFDGHLIGARGLFFKVASMGHDGRLREFRRTRRHATRDP